MRQEDFELDVWSDDGGSCVLEEEEYVLTVEQLEERDCSGNEIFSLAF